MSGRTRLNPVLARELRERVRSVRTFVALSAYLLVLVLVTWVVDRSADLGGDEFFVDLSNSTSQGAELFDWIVFAMLLLILFLVPGITAGSVAGERERQTLSTLQVTLLRPVQILWGKVTSSLAFVLLLVVATLPLFAIAFLLGGITIGQTVRGVAALALVSLLVAVCVVGVSALVRRVQTATVLSYALVLVLALGSFVAYGVLSLLGPDDGTDDDPPAAILLPNVVVLVADLVAGGGDSAADSPLRGIAELVDDASTDGARFLADDPFDPADAEDDAPRWIASLLLLTVPAAGLFVWGTAAVRTPARAER